MPNWCYNKITIRAGAETRKKIRNLLQGKQYYRAFSADSTVTTPLSAADSEFCFHNIIPQPDFLLDKEDPRRKTDAPYIEGDNTMPGWYTWRVDNWGTKWDVSEVSVHESTVALTYHFDTAWAPPEPVIRRLSEMFPNAHITLYFDEPGCIGKGSIQFKDGEVVKETGVAC